ncbi:MAG: NAD-dependent epimerase/dehydratase family protein [Longimicrobiales bacterium]
MSDESRKVLVTGGAGFIASHVAEAYLARGDQVFIADNLSSGRMENVPSAAEFVEIDVTDPALGDLIRKERFDLINHHAAQIDVRVSVMDPARDAGINIMGLINLTEAAREAGTKRFIFVSSGGVVYGEPEQIPTPEQAPKLPLSPYGVSKLTGEYYLSYYRHIHDLEYVALRYSNVYGPRQDPHGEAGVVAIFSTRLLDGEPLAIYGDGEQTRDYVFVRDVVSANMKVSDLTLPEENSLDGWAFNVGTEIATSVNRLADVLESVSGTETGREYRDPRAGELRDSTLATGKIQSRGWAPAFDLREGLKETFQHIRDQRS